MTSPDQDPADDREVLVELERLQRGIEQARQQRADKLVEFTSLLSLFHSESEGAAADSGRSQTRIHASTAEHERPPISIGSPLSSGSSAEFPDEPPRPKVGLPERRPPAPPRRGGWVTTAAAAAIVVAGAAAITVWQRSGPSVPTSGSTSAAPSAPEPAPPQSPAEPATKPRSPLRVEMTTVRPVWVRVLVDDRRAIERELPAGQQIPLDAERTIVVRAGDAGAVRLVVDGRDEGALGRDGQPVTRTFSAAPARDQEQ